MCRLYAVHASRPSPLAEPLVDSPTSIAHLSRCDGEREKHLHGWGLGWYDDRGPQVVRSIAPACNDPAFARAARTVQSPIVMAHVRDASVGSVCDANTHPFAYGPWLFCHNGTINGFERLRPSFERETLPELQAVRRGTTDSEYLFQWILSNTAREGFALTADGDDRPGNRADVDGLYGVVRESLRRLLGWCAAADVAEPKGLNLVLTDGRLLLAVRHGLSLWTQTLPSLDGARPAVVVASEPTDRRGPWRELDDRSILTTDALGHVVVRPI